MQRRRIDWLGQTAYTLYEFFDDHHNAAPPRGFGTDPALGLALLATVRGNYETAYAQDAYRLAKESGNRWLMGYGLNLLGEVSRVLGHDEEARQYYQQGYFVREEFNDPEGMAAALNLLARTACLRAD